ncbi:hypothetical protein [Enterobacter hormaechei]|uniref:hypothetical protein n=1 Tax=Enterobacter hormaechei TaxID=158836 RepID=UPI000A4CD981|nr:hypothetical protein [Enterobacter hormaechei]MDM1703261.1 hypothetical protein [Enterobacter hormaechei]
MNQVILILEGHKPQLINVADDVKSFSHLLSDGSEVCVDIMTAYVMTSHGEQESYLVATDIDDISPREIQRAAELLFPSS